MEWSTPHPFGFAMAMGLGLLGLSLLARRAAKSRDARSLSLVILRGLTLAVLVLILLDPVRVVETHILGDRPTAVYLFDTSRSMGLERPSTRLDKASRVIEQAQRSIDPSRMPKLACYRFGRQLSALSPGESPRAVDDESRLRDALERLPARFGETLPFGVFLFSDGRSTESSGFDNLSKGYAKLGVPIHVLPVGDLSTSGDVSIRDLIVPRTAPQGSKVPIKVVVQSQRFDGRRAEVLIRPASGKDVRPLSTVPITLEGGEQSANLVIEADRARVPMLAEVVPLPGEAVLENNSVPFRIGARDRKIRVIYMEGSPAPEYAFIRDALNEDPAIECVAMQTDHQSAGQARIYRVDNPSLGYPKTREELFYYDVIICSDVSRASFTAEQLEWTVDLVAKRGGGFVMIGGHTSYGSGGWDRTSWDGMIPIDMSGDGPNRSSPFYNGEFKVIVAPGAEAHPIWRIVDDPVKNREILARMPSFGGTNLTDRLKPAATLLGLSDRTISPLSPTDTSQKGSTPSSTRKPQGSPIFSAQPYGRGRSFAMSTDSTTSWGYNFEHSWGEGDNRYFRKFWRNVVTWLAEESLGAGGRIEVEVDKVIYRPGQPIQVKAKALDEKMEPTDRYRLVARLIRPNSEAPQGDSTPMGPPATMIPRAEALEFTATLDVPPVEQLRRESGLIRQGCVVEVTSYDGEKLVGRSTTEVQLLDDSEEFRDPRPDRSRLETLARQTGGEVLEHPEDLARLLERSTETVDRVVTSRSPAWDSPIVLAILCGLLTIEWILRRSKGLA